MAMSGGGGGLASREASRPATRPNAQAECDPDALPPSNANLTCSECVEKILKAMGERAPPGTYERCAPIAHEFVEKGCKVGPRSFSCKRSFQLECNNTARPRAGENHRSCAPARPPARRTAWPGSRPAPPARLPSFFF